MNARPNLGYRLGNAAFHAAHLAMILFLTTGWAFPRLRLMHLLSMALILGLWAAVGGCPLTTWHWDFKVGMGQPRPRGPYIHFLAEYLSRRKLNAKKLDRRVIALTVGIALLSLALNVMPHFH